MLVTVVRPANILVPVTPNVPDATMLVACSPASTLVPVTPNVPLNVADVAFNKLNVLLPVTFNAPLNVAEVALIVFVNVPAPPTYIPPPIPTPPTTTNVPVVVEVAAVVCSNKIDPVLNTPYVALLTSHTCVEVLRSSPPMYQRSSSDALCQINAPCSSPVASL